MLGVYEGTSVESLTELGFNDDDPDRGCCSSWLALVDAEASTTYMIQVGPLEGFGGEGVVTLSWSPLILGTERPGHSHRDAGRRGDPRARRQRRHPRRRRERLALRRQRQRPLGGQGGDDVIFDRRGHDVLRGAAGADILDARDRRRGDQLLGGPGADQCRRDRGDLVRNCP